MKAARRIRQKLEKGEVVTGVLATFHLWTGLVEVLRRAGLDYVIVDLEHGAYSDSLVADVCAAGRQQDFAVFVRPSRADYDTARTAMDRGPCGFLLPTVEGAADLDQVGDAIRLPPRGRRRPGGMGNYWVSDTQYRNWAEEVEEDFIVIPQIENRIGLDRADEIASHEITTAIGVGPYDLSAALGVCWEPEHPDLLGALEAIRDAGERAGKTMWMIGDADDCRRKGWHFICVGEPVMMLEATLRDVQGRIGGE